MTWLPMEMAPRDGTEILARRHNDCFWEHIVLWWADDSVYPWKSENNAYVDGRWTEWMPIPGGIGVDTGKKHGRGDTVNNQLTDD